MNNFFRLLYYNNHNVCCCDEDRFPRFSGTPDPNPQLHCRWFLFRRRHVLDGFRQVGDHPSYQGAQEQWYSVHCDCPNDHSTLHRRVYGDFPIQQEGHQACPARVRHHSLNFLFFDFIKKITNNPNMIIPNI